MKSTGNQPPISEASYTLVTRRTIEASPERLFAAWTQPEQLKSWWGPANVICTDAEIDLRVGGRYRIGNRFPDGQLVWIEGEFEVITPPRRLVYTWRLGSASGGTERVSVSFEPRDNATEVIITHGLVPDTSVRDQHAQGWHGCLDGLEKYLRTGR